MPIFKSYHELQSNHLNLPQEAIALQSVNLVQNSMKLGLVYAESNVMYPAQTFFLV